MRNKKILLGITGSIAAYKAADLVSRLRKLGAEVRVVMTAAAEQFITPLTMQALSGNLVRTAMFSGHDCYALEHIDLARWAELVLVAPASANFIARLSAGMADDLLTTICLATAAPVMLAPGMNHQMWSNQATLVNVNKLQQRGVKFLGPASGWQACGEEGVGRMLEPQAIINELVKPAAGVLSGKRILITAGPTHEALDPVRYLANYSSGKMGFALARAAVAAGAKVTLVSGPVALATPCGVERIEVTTADEMHQAVMHNIENVDIFISAAAVTDYRPAIQARQKIKKNSESLTIDLVRNPDILAEVAKREPRPLVVGFAAETEKIVENASKKLKAKALDIVIANKVGNGLGFAVDKIEVVLCNRAGKQLVLPLADKTVVAQQIITNIAKKEL